MFVLDCIQEKTKTLLAKASMYNILEEATKSRRLFKKIYKKSSFSRK